VSKPIENNNFLFLWQIDGGEGVGLSNNTCFDKKTFFWQEFVLPLSRRLKDLHQVKEIRYIENKANCM